jgi:hypothetical protein
MNMQEFNKQFPDEETSSVPGTSDLANRPNLPHCGGVKSWSISAEGRRSGHQ